LGKQQPVAGTASAIAQKAWRRLSSGEGTKGPRWHDWAYLELADLEAGWSIQEIRRIALKLIQRRIPHAHILAWSSWRRAHQANARKAHLRQKMQL
jgi:SRSO17 transposase